MIRIVEEVIRPYLYAFILFSGLFSLINETLEVNLIWKIVASLFFIAVSIPLGKRMHKSMEEFFKGFDWDEQCVIIEYRILKRIMQGAGVVILYFYVQVGIIAIFIPDFLFVKIYEEVPLFVPFLCANLFPIILFHKRFIWKEFSGELL